MPVVCFHASYVGAFSASPALTQWRRCGKRYDATSIRTSIRYAVAGPQKTVIGYFASVFSTSSGSNLPRMSITNTVAPMFHGPKKFDHAVLPQPVSASAQTVSFSPRSSQYPPVMRCASP